MTPELTPYEAESLASGYLPASAVPKVSDAVRRYHGIDAEPGSPAAPIPYSLTPAAEAALDNSPSLGSYPGINDPERLAAWCGFASAADMCAAYEAYADDLEARAEYEAEWADNWDSEDSAAYAERVESGLDPEAEP